MTWTVRLAAICVLLIPLRLSADSPVPASTVNYVSLLPPAVIAKGSIFEMPPGGADVYICTVVPNTWKTGLDSDHGSVELKVIRSLTGAAEKTLKVRFDLPYGIVGFNLEEEARAARDQRLAVAVWPDLSRSKPDDQILIAIGKTLKGKAKGYDGLPVDVFQLARADDPIIEQVQRIIELRDTKSVDELKAQCRQILEARAGVMAMQTAAFVTLDRIAPVDPVTAMEFITLRLQSPDRISSEELGRDLTFLDKYLESHDPNRQLGDALIPLLIASPEEFHLPFWNDEEATSRRLLDRKVLHVLAKVINEVHVGVNSRRESALRAVVEDLKNGDKDEDALKVLEWVKTVKEWDGRM